VRPLPLLAAALLVALAAAGAAPLFLDILPPGQDGLVPASTVTAGAHAPDQLAMYRDLILAAPGLAEPDLARFFKDASIGAPAAPERVETPRPGVTVARDAFGVPHVTGATRGDVFFGAGWVTAEDRLFLADALRNMGRGRFTQFAGDLRDVLGAVGFDRTYAAVAGYYYGYLSKVLRQALGRRVRGRYRMLRCADGRRAACAAAVRGSLAAAADALTARFGSASPATWQAEPRQDDIHFALAGTLVVGPIPWQNRPTFQQVVQIRP